MIKKFKCGICKIENRLSMTMKDLRGHLKTEHFIKTKLTNMSHKPDEMLTKQSWWITEEFK